jgi:hypothetical protein
MSDSPKLDVTTHFDLGMPKIVPPGTTVDQHIRIENEQVTQRGVRVTAKLYNAGTDTPCDTAVAAYLHPGGLRDSIEYDLIVDGSKSRGRFRGGTTTTDGHVCDVPVHKVETGAPPTTTPGPLFAVRTEVTFQTTTPRNGAITPSAAWRTWPDPVGDQLSITV